MLLLEYYYRYTNRQKEDRVRSVIRSHVHEEGRALIGFDQRLVGLLDSAPRLFAADGVADRHEDRGARMGSPEFFGAENRDAINDRG